MKAITIFFILTISALGFSNPSENITRILNSGDGKSYQTAYEVYNVDEEYQLLEYLKLNPKMQTLILFEGQYYDVLHDGEKAVYFKICVLPK